MERGRERKREGREGVREGEMERGEMEGREGEREGGSDGGSEEERLPSLQQVYNHMKVTQLTASGYITTTLTYVLSICSSQWTQTVESHCADTLLHRCLSFALRTGVQTLQSVVSIEQAVDSF